MPLFVWPAFPISSLQSGKWPCRSCQADRWSNDAFSSSGVLVSIIIVACTKGKLSIVVNSSGYRVRVRRTVAVTSGVLSLRSLAKSSMRSSQGNRPTTVNTLDLIAYSNAEICTRAASQGKQHAKIDWRQETVLYKAANDRALKRVDDVDVKVWLPVRQAPDLAPERRTPQFWQKPLPLQAYPQPSGNDLSQSRRSEAVL
jgi:hypothetical protein